jgi:outer membrane protein assembly factor BamE (lipoprotein component of BamABCDE complex)
MMVILVAGCASSVRYTQDEIKNYPQKVQDLIMKGEVAIGMTPSQVRYAWGSPDHTYMREPLDGKQREEWVYTFQMGMKKKIVVFEDGKVAHILGQ